MQTVLLVEGDSDRIAVETLAGRRGQDLDGVRIVDLRGVTNASKAMTEFGPSGQGLRLVGLCDIGEERFFRGGLERAGFGSVADLDTMEGLGFFVCNADLEDELIRCLGETETIRILEQEGDLRAFRVFQNQPFQRDRTAQRQLHRFIGTTSGRKAQYARALVEGLDLRRVPRPLEALLDLVGEESGP
jgi:hypothetical protein